MRSCGWCGSTEGVRLFLAGPLCASHHPPGAVVDGPVAVPRPAPAPSSRDNPLERRVRESAARARKEP